MRSVLIRSLAVSAALSALSGCAFVQWTDHAYFGSPDDPPIHSNREWVGAVILPAAVIGDIVTSPAQVVALMVMGDDGIYSPLVGPGSSSPSSGRSVRPAEEAPSPVMRKRYKTNKIKCPAPTDDQWGSLQVDPATRLQLAAKAEADLATSPSSDAGVRVWGADVQGEVAELALSTEQRDVLAACLRSGQLSSAGRVRRGA